MRKSILFYLLSFMLLIFSFVSFISAYREIKEYTALMARTNSVYNCFQDLSKNINKAAVSNPVLNHAGRDNHADLFFADAQTVTGRLEALKRTVRDSVNIKIADSLDYYIRSELQWIVESDVPDSIEGGLAIPHIIRLEKIDSLISRGISRTDDLIRYHQEKLSRATTAEKAYMMLFTFLSGMLLLYSCTSLYRQQKQIKGKENELEISNRLLRNAQQIGHIGNWRLKLATGDFYLSDEIYNIWGLSTGSGDFGYDHFISSFHPDDAALVNAAMTAAYERDELNIEHRIRLKDGTIKWVHQKGRITGTSGAGDKNFEATLQDITERKTIETELKQAAVNQQLFASIINSSNDAVISKDLDGIIMTWNHAAEEIFGYTATEMTGSHISRIIPPGLTEEELQIISRIKNGEYVQNYETVRVKKDGSLLDISLTVSPVLDAGGHIIGASKIARDVTEKKRTARMIEQVSQEKTAILESIDDAFFAVDDKWMVIYWNSKAQTILGRSKEEMLGSNLWEVFPSSVNSNSYHIYHRALATGTAELFEEYYAPLEGWFEVSAYPSPTGLSIYFKNITARKKAEIRLNELNDNLNSQAGELARSNAELEQFAYVASHDLQEPLRMVSNFLTQLEKKYNDLLDDKGKRYIAFAVDGAKRMRQIILDLLQFSRVGKTEDKKENLDSGELVREILVLFRKKMEEENAIVEIYALPVVYSYKIALYQVFQNLISNAMKYVAKGIQPVIHITADELDEYWQFTVSDNGIGIEEEYFEKIFVIFQRLHNRTDYSGTGMGLAITKKIVDGLGGKIWVDLSRVKEVISFSQ